jgi:hypothetical protein
LKDQQVANNVELVAYNSSVYYFGENDFRLKKTRICRVGEMSVGLSARRVVRAEAKKVEKSISLLQTLQEGHRELCRVERWSSRHVAPSGPERTVFLRRRGARRISAGTLAGCSAWRPAVRSGQYFCRDDTLGVSRQGHILQ